MIAFLRRNPMLAVLAVFAIALLVVVGVQTGWGSRFRPTIPAPVPKAPAPVEAKVLPTVVATAPEQAYPETVSRPLFTPTRRPAPVASVSAVPVIPRGMFSLVGTTIAGETRIAMLREKSSGRVHRVEVGRELNGAKIARIEPDRVHLILGDVQEEVVMTVQKATAIAPPMGAMASAQGPFPAAPAPVGTGAPGSGLGGGGPTAGSALPGPGGAPAPGTASAGPGAQGVATPGAPQPGPIATGQTPAATTSPMTPEELLARRRARRAQQPQ